MASRSARRSWPNETTVNPQRALSFAQNYLAHHAYTSSNHVQLNHDQDEYFNEAKAAEHFVEIETSADREAYRQQLDKQATQVVKKRKRPHEHVAVKVSDRAGRSRVC